MLADEVVLILNESFEKIVSSELSLKLISLYSKIYLNGAQCGFCEASQRKYYNQLQIDGMEQAEKIDKAKNRTCVPAWKDLLFIPRTGDHYNCELISDQQAFDLLKGKYIGEELFTKLPDQYLIEVCGIDPVSGEEIKAKKTPKTK